MLAVHVACAWRHARNEPLRSLWQRHNLMATKSTEAAKDSPGIFSRYQKFVVAVLAFLQFTIVLDFMLMAPLGALVIPKLNITPSQFELL
jgi:hypothetical protein